MKSTSSAALRRRRHQLVRTLPPIEQVIRGAPIETYKRYGRPNAPGKIGRPFSNIVRRENFYARRRRAGLSSSEAEEGGLRNSIQPAGVMVAPLHRPPRLAIEGGLRASGCPDGLPPC